ncbi:MAG: diaminopimelate decarboxylase [Planctomycetota bacterium]|nr:MAG: diaminopimelate decarboxylase [Planctomycetota bacterium]REJ88834.1 MAG: diaminopimelate decarboxylase [Planctomycetota bacterium]REK29462.1 MAG: diaminopimelate decarboxylase [Planctomycetota bacterium]REK31827.1 MAG: diaminopimelate decarboxylase [Planctomycetota bacterium]
MDAFEYRQGQLFCEDVPVADLAEEFGSPLWVYSAAKLRHEYGAIRDAFSEVDPVICYSVKANGNLSLLKLLNDEGCSFDIVSGGELYRVQQSGSATERVIFAGVGKTDAEIRFALEADILMFNVESEAELDAISAVAGSMSRVAPVALRLNPDIDARTHAKTTTGKKGNKFGMDIERHNELAAKVLGDANLELRGIHMHLGSPILTTDPYEAAAKKALEVVRDLRAKGHQTNWINLGGGFGLSYLGNEAPPYSEYARVILPCIRQAECRLALEPGRSICGNAGILVTRVIFTKREGGKLFVIQDGGMNDLVRPAMYDSFHRIWPVRPAVPPPDDYQQEIPGCEPADVVGPICESGDYLARNRWLPPVERGDLLSTFSAGAYGTVMSSHYNARPLGAEVLVEGDAYRLIRRRETYDDLIATERD